MIWCGGGGGGGALPALVPSCVGRACRPRLRWLDTVFKNSGVQHFDMFKLRIFRIYSADIGVFIYFDNSTFKLY